MSTKKAFYIFLDIDGVMYDWDYYIGAVKSGELKKRQLFKYFKPESINALNKLIGELGQTYDVKIVISSTWRSCMENVISTLNNNGLKYDKPISRTPLTGNPFYRGRQIKEFLFDKTNYEFVIIDDEYFDFKEHFKPKNIIKTEMFHSALSLEMVDKFLKEHYSLNIEK